jgi:pyruvate/2-oxoglutarate dehydrogenase complex dihydrolipoamide acyltransferase (E2) component
MERIERRPFPAHRKWVLGAMRAGHRMTPMTALVQVDVTEAWKRIEAEDLSPTAFVLACVGRAAADHPEVHAYRDWLGRLVIHPHVNIATMIEVPTSTGLFPLAHVVRDAEARSIDDLSDELRNVKVKPEKGRSGRLIHRWGRIASRVPGLPWVVYAISRRSAVARRGVGTVAVSAVGMMIGGGGALISVMSLASLQVLVGAATDRPWVVNGEVTVRRILDITVQVDHRVVDGGPAGRFGATLRQLLEDPDLVDW